MLEIRLLGQFQVQVDGEPVLLGSRQAQTLLSYLLLPPGRRHRREQLAGVLWPEVSDSKARARLRYSLWQVRQALGPNAIQSDKVEISFRPQSEFWLDTAILDRIEVEPHDLDDLRFQVALYAGDLLPGFYEDWLIPERTRFRVVFEQKIEQLLVGLLAQRRYAEVIELSELWISIGQPPERAYRALIAAHTLRGDAAAAVMSYQRCVRMLDDELAVAPSAKTEALRSLINSGGTEAEILQNTGLVSKAPPVYTLQTGEQEPLLPDPVPDEELVARADELEWLEEKWQSARNGAGSFVLVSGEAGRGKSALLWHLARQLLVTDTEMVVVAGRGEAYFGQGDPHLLFRDVLATLAGDVEGRSSRETISHTNARRLWNLVPTTSKMLLDFGPDLLGTFLSAEALYGRVQRIAARDTALLTRLHNHLKEISNRRAPIHVAHGNAQRAVFEQYTRVLRALAAEHPLLILLDDLHWADRGSLDLLFHLGRRIENERILIIAALRLDEIAAEINQGTHPAQQILTEFGRIFGSFELNLDQTDSGKAVSLSSALLDRTPNRYDAEFRRQLYQLARGHPLFTLELLRQMRERGELKQDNDGRWYQTGDIDWDILPARVEAVIAGRLLQLPLELREILSVASVEGERFTTEVVAAALNRPPGEILRLLDQELHRRHFLVEPVELRRVGARQISRYRFHHHLFQKYLYERQEPAFYAQRHESIAWALEDIYRNELDSMATRLAFHFDQAGLPSETLRYLLMAGEHAKRQSADWEAIQAFQRGLKTLRELPPSPVRDRQELAFQAALGAPFVALYGWWSEEAEAAFERARELAESLGRSEQLPPVLWGLWSYYLVRGSHTRAMTMAKQILERTEKDFQPDLFLTAHWTLGISSAVLGKWLQAKEHLELAVSSYDEVVQSDLTYRYGQSPGVTCLFWLALTLWMQGESEAAFARCRQCLELADREGHLFSRAFGLACAAGLYAMDNDINEARSHSEKALQLARAGGYPFLLAMALIVQGWAGVMRGAVEDGPRDIKKGLYIMEKSGARIFQPFFLSLAVEAQLRVENYPAARELLHQAFAISKQDGDDSVRAHLHQLNASLLSAEGAAQLEVSAELDRSLQIARRQAADQWVQRSAAVGEKLLGKPSPPTQS